MIAVLQWMWRNLGSLLLAFILALIVWVSAVTSDNPTVNQVYPRPIPLQVENLNPDLMLVSQTPDTVQVTLSAPQTIQAQLSADPNSIHAYLDLSGLGAGDHTVPVGIQVNARPVQITKKEPAEVHLTLEPLQTRTFSITLQVDGQPAQGYQAGEPSYNPTTATVSGPQSAVSQVNQVRAILNVANASQPIQSTLNLQAVDANGTTINNVNITPSTITVKVPITLLGGYRNVVVYVKTTGQVADGYQLTNIVVTPPNVVVFSSNPQLLNDLPGYVETKPISLDGVQANIATYVDLDLPAGISVANDQKVLVQISVDAIESSLNMTLPVEVTGLAAGFTARVDPPSVNVTISGPVAMLNSLTPNDLRVMVDMTGKGIGVYQVTPMMNFSPSRVRSLTFTPASVNVTIDRAPTPTPVPTVTITPTASP
jgi:YbbR domain-containing protein